MNNFPTELIYVLAFAALALVQYLLKRFGTPEQHDVTAPNDALETPYGEIKESPVASALQSARVDHFVPGKASRNPSAPVRSRFDRASVLGTKRDVQNAVVIAAILGPCRACEPYDER